MITGRRRAPSLAWRVLLAVLGSAVLLAVLWAVPWASAQDGAAAPGADADSVSSSVQRGPVTVTARLQPAAISIGDTLTLTLEVRAAPGVEVLLPEFGQSLQRLPILDFVPASRIDDEGHSVATQRYRLQPQHSGEQQVPPMMVEFVDRRPGQQNAPPGEDAYEVLTERLPFTVASVLPADASSDLHPARGVMAAPLLGADRVSTLAVVGAVLLGVAVLLGLLIRHQRRAPRPVAADQVALARLLALRERPLTQAEHMEPFFVELTDIVRRYVEDRFGLHAPELTTEEFLDAAAHSPDLSRAQQGFLREFLSSADRVKFARHVPSREAAEAALDAVSQFIEQTRAAEPVEGPAHIPEAVRHRA